MMNSDSGTVTIATSGEQRRDDDHHHDDADDGEQRRQELAQRLLEALGDVVDVVGDPAQQVTARLAVDVAERQRVELVLDLGPQPEHRALHDAGERVRLQPRQDGRADVEAERGEQRPVQRAEVDAAAADARHDEVGGVAEDLRAEHDEGDADDGQDDDEGEARALRAHAPQEAAGRRTEVERLLERDRRRAHAAAAEPSPGLGRGRAVSPIVRLRRTSRCRSCGVPGRSCDATISA